METAEQEKFALIGGSLQFGGSDLHMLRQVSISGFRLVGLAFELLLSLSEKIQESDRVLALAGALRTQILTQSQSLAAYLAHF